MKTDPNIVIYGKLIAAVTTSDLALMAEVEQRLAQKFSECSRVTATFPFDFTRYYTEEMGPNLQKKFLSFSDMIPIDTLPEIKLFTNDLEQYYAIGGKRRINIDPGYLTHAHMVLATTKAYTHRIYLGKGIYAELTYLCRKSVFQIMEWTYPDYRTPQALAFFEAVRQDYLQHMREKRQAESAE